MCGGIHMQAHTHMHARTCVDIYIYMDLHIYGHVWRYIYGLACMTVYDVYDMYDMYDHVWRYIHASAHAHICMHEDAWRHTQMHTGLTWV